MFEYGSTLRDPVWTDCRDPTWGYHPLATPANLEKSGPARGAPLTGSAYGIRREPAKAAG
jgi:hypothetical protein